MDSVRQDVAFAFRALRQRPGQALLALASLGLGVGASTAIFSVVNGVLLEPLAYPRADDVVVLWDRLEDGGLTGDPSAPNFEDWRAASASFEALAGSWGGAWALTGDDLPAERVVGGRMTPELLDVLGIDLELGRPFREEETLGRHRVALISHGLWRSRFGGAPDVVGRAITLDGERHEVIGVLPEIALPMNRATVVMTVPGEHHVWLPVDRTDPWYQRRTTHMTLVLGRLAEGVTVARAQAEMDGIARALEERHPEANTGRGVLVRPIREQIVGDVRADLLLVLGAVTFVLLVACANLAGLLLARALEREREVAVRVALGATRGRIVRQALTEVALLAAAGAALGLGAAVAGKDLLLRLSPADLPRRAEIGVDATVLAFTLTIALLATVLAGSLPALRMAGTLPGAALSAGGARTIGGRRTRSLARGLVLAQLALVVVLLFGSGLLLRTLASLRSAEPGVRVDHLAVVPLLLPAATYDNAAAIAAYHASALDAVLGVAGVREAVLTYDPPLAATWYEGFTIVGRPAPEPGAGPAARFRPVGAGYFEAMGIPVLAGRAFLSSDRIGAPGAAIVNRALADRHFPGGSAVGQRILTGTPHANFPEAPEEFEIVGVVENVAFGGPRAGPQPALYVPLGQFPVPYFHVLARTSVPPVALATALRAALRGLDPGVPVPEVTTLEAIRDRLVARERFLTVLATAFALLALVVAAAGVHGVLSFAVAARTREMGVRQALGAQPREILSMMLAESLRMAGAGLALGVLAAPAAGRILAATLFGTAATDPTVLAGVALTLVAVALAAGLAPALRAARIAPGEALRAD